MHFSSSIVIAATLVAGAAAKPHVHKRHPHPQYKAFVPSNGTAVAAVTQAPSSTEGPVTATTLETETATVISCSSDVENCPGKHDATSAAAATPSSSAIADAASGSSSVAAIPTYGNFGGYAAPSGFAHPSGEMKHHFSGYPSGFAHPSGAPVQPHGAFGTGAAASTPSASTADAANAASSVVAPLGTGEATPAAKLGGAPYGFGNETAAAVASSGTGVPLVTTVPRKTAYTTVMKYLTTDVYVTVTMTTGSAEAQSTITSVSPSGTTTSTLFETFYSTVFDTVTAYATPAASAADAEGSSAVAPQMTASLSGYGDNVKAVDNNNNAAAANTDSTSTTTTTVHSTSTHMDYVTVFASSPSATADAGSGSGSAADAENNDASSGCVPSTVTTTAYETVYVTLAASSAVGASTATGASPLPFQSSAAPYYPTGGNNNAAVGPTGSGYVGSTGFLTQVAAATATPAPSAGFPGTYY